VLSALTLRVDGAHDPAADVVQLPGLRLGERVEDKPSDVFHVTGSGLDELRPAILRQDREGSADVIT
jgi:hypothetical protein